MSGGWEPTAADPPVGEAVFRSLVEHSRDVVSRHDRAGTCLYVSPAARDVLGVSPDELIGRNGLDLVHPDDLAAVEKSHRGAASTGFTTTVACRLRHSSGAWVWVEVTSLAVTDDAGRVTELQCATRDVSDRKKVENRLAEAEERFRLTLDGAPIGMALVDPAGPLLRVNQALCELFGQPVDELRTKTFQQLTHPEDLDADLAHLGLLLAGDIPGYRLEKRFLRADGTVLWGLLSVGLVRSPDGAPRHLVAQILDMTDRKTEREQLQRLADRDALTDLYNRRRFREEAELQLARAHRHHETAAVLLMDVDGLKQVNDVHGHHAGDQTIRAVAAVLLGQTRDTDTVARLGGDEFAVLLPTGSPETTDAVHAAQRVSDLIRTALRDSSVAAAPGVLVEVSIGTAVLDADVTDVDHVLVLADQEMYRDKRRRRERRP